MIKNDHQEEKDQCYLWPVKQKVELKKYSREEHESMLTTQHQQLYELWRLIKCKKTPESSRDLEDRVSALEAKTENVAMRLYSQMLKSPKEIIQPLTEREMTLDRAMQISDDQGCQKGTVSPVS